MHWSCHLVKYSQPRFVALARVIAYLQDFARKRKLEYKQDSVGNMVIRRPGSGGGDSAPTIVIQVRSSYNIGVLVSVLILLA